jgi:hypothetical protein
VEFLRNEVKKGIKARSGYCYEKAAAFKKHTFWGQQPARNRHFIADFLRKEVEKGIEAWPGQWQLQGCCVATTTCSGVNLHVTDISLWTF